MIEEEEINNLYFVAQTTYYIYKKENRLAEATLITSDKNKFEANKELARKNEEKGKDNEFIVF